MNPEPIPAEAGGTCDCCKRTHRKLYSVGSYRLGATCRETYRHYTRECGFWTAERRAQHWQHYPSTARVNVYRMVGAA